METPGTQDAETDPRHDAGSTAGGSEDLLAPHREAINEIDVAVVALLNQRTESSLAIAAIKLNEGLPVHVSDREDEVLDRVSSANEGGIIPDEDIRDFFKQIMAMSRAVQQRVHDARDA